MPNLNRVMLMGNLTRDPELRYLPSNTAVVSLGLAVNRRWRNQQTNEQQEETTFVDCEAFGRQAEVLNQYLRKGRPLFIEGRLKLDQWQDREGQKRSKLKVVIESFQFVDSREGGGGGDHEGPSGYGSSDAAPRSNAVAPRGGGYGSGNHGGGNFGGGAGRGDGAGGGSQYDPGADQPHQPVEDDDIPF